MGKVTISLERYKELEKCENLAKEISEVLDIRKEKEKLDEAVNNKLVRTISYYTPFLKPGGTSFKTEDKALKSILSLESDNIKSALCLVLKKIRIKDFKKWQKESSFSYCPTGYEYEILNQLLNKE